MATLPGSPAGISGKDVLGGLPRAFGRLRAGREDGMLPEAGIDFHTSNCCKAEIEL
jgi:hypothetical protein